MGSGAEAKENDGLGVRGGVRTSLHGIWTAPGYGVILPLPGEEDNRKGQNLDGGGWEPQKGP